MSDAMGRLAVVAGTALLVLALVTWIVRSGLDRPMSLRLTVLPVAAGVVLVAAGILRWAVAA
ncbi:MAG: hypothetical protein EPO16_06585 [Dehalococcoidia bacterium]|nr:MAG: hypothetical protein EPO16_06585 [Dehalococcoidia bacterium]